MTQPSDEHLVVDNPERSRYELRVGDVIASTAEYHRVDDVVVISYVRTEPELRGRGMSDRLMHGVLDDLRANDLRIEPVCWVAVAYVENHPAEAAALLAS